LPKERAFLFSKQETIPDLKKRNALLKEKYIKSITSEKYLKKKDTFELFYLKICNQRMSIIYGKRKIQPHLP
jgi:hypothetical protein